jgi:hypothetical protein
MVDDGNKPPHYTKHPSGVECIEITEHLNFCLGNAVKYIWRSGLKTDDPLKDLKKAAWYINREIERLSKQDRKEALDELVKESEELKLYVTERDYKGQVWGAPHYIFPNGIEDSKNWCPYTGSLINKEG